MKRFLTIALSIFALASCTNNDDSISNSEKENLKLVDAVITAKVGNEMSTRSYLGTVSGNETQGYQLTHLFEIGDKFYVFDYAGSYQFVSREEGQTSTFNGKWAEVKDDEEKGIIAMFPVQSSKTNLTLNKQNHPVMEFNLPTNQTTRLQDETQVTYALDAGLAFACASEKSANLWFCPVVSYLYFHSSKEKCTISSNVGISGNYKVTYSGNAGTGTNASGIDYNSPDGLAKFLSYEADNTTINCTGIRVEGHKNKFDKFHDYEYIICVKPGEYESGSLNITPEGSTESFHNTTKFTMIPSTLYYIGSIDKQ